MDRKKKLIVAVTGASGSIYARLLCEHLSRVESVGEIALIASENGSQVAVFEDSDDWMRDPRFTRYDCGEMFAPPASVRLVTMRWLWCPVRWERQAE